jgi:uncharacterized membrane protein
MPERKKTTAKKAPAKTAGKRTASATAVAAQKPATVQKAVTPPSPQAVASTAPKDPTAAAKEVCPRCGTEKFGPEERTRLDGRRTVRYTVLVCERGHTFAKPARRTA